VLDAHPGVLYDAYAHASAFSQQCASIIGSSEYSIGRFVSTVSVARDMLHIIEKIGEDRLKYWGFSYGTFLGVTFASIWPERVGRMVLDGMIPHLPIFLVIIPSID
jgi:pimeloyl-ACP methyl ester carboxylesterase